MLELGSAVGISGAYLAAAPPVERLVSIEGSSLLAQVAAATIETVSDAASIECGAFESSLPSVLDSLAGERVPIDLAYIDGHHVEAATVHYAESLLPHLRRGSLVILDDITLWEGMRDAWCRLASLPGCLRPSTPDASDCSSGMAAMTCLPGGSTSPVTQAGGGPDRYAPRGRNRQDDPRLSLESHQRQALRRSGVRHAARCGNDARAHLRGLRDAANRQRPSVPSARGNRRGRDPHRVLRRGTPRALDPSLGLRPRAGRLHRGTAGSAHQPGRRLRHKAPLAPGGCPQSRVARIQTRRSTVRPAVVIPRTAVRGKPHIRPGPTLRREPAGDIALGCRAFGRMGPGPSAARREKRPGAIQLRGDPARASPDRAWRNAVGPLLPLQRHHADRGDVRGFSARATRRRWPRSSSSSCPAVVPRFPHP